MWIILVKEMLVLWSVVEVMYWKLGKIEMVRWVGVVLFLRYYWFLVVYESFLLRFFFIEFFDNGYGFIFFIIIVDNFCLGY